MFHSFDNFVQFIFLKLVLWADEVARLVYFDFIRLVLADNLPPLRVVFYFLL